MDNLDTVTTVTLPRMGLCSEVKAMPLDLSYQKRCSTEIFLTSTPDMSSSSTVLGVKPVDDDDDVILTLEVPGNGARRAARRLGRRLAGGGVGEDKPIVIVSSDSDSDSDITFLPDVSTGPVPYSSTSSSIGAGMGNGGIKLKVDRVLTDLDSDGEEDCFVSSYLNPSTLSGSCSTLPQAGDCLGAVRPINPNPGMKRMYEETDSSSQSSSSPASGGSSNQTRQSMLGSLGSREGAQMMTLDPVVLGNDPFLSDASSINNELTGSRLRAARRVAMKRVPPTIPFTESVDDDDVIDQYLFMQRKIGSSLKPVGWSASIDSPVDAVVLAADEPDRGDKSKPLRTVDTPSSVAMPDSPSFTPLTFGVSHVVSNATKMVTGSSSGTTGFNISSLSGTDLCPVTACRTYENILNDSHASNVTTAGCSAASSTSHSRPSPKRKAMITTINKTSSTIDFSAASPFRIVLPKQSAIPGADRYGSSRDGLDTTIKVDASSDAGSPPPDWKVISTGDCKVRLRRSISQTTASAIDSARSLIAESSRYKVLGASKRQRLALHGTSSSSDNINDSVNASCSSTLLDQFLGNPGLTSRCESDLLRRPTVVVAEETSLCYGCRDDIVVSQLSYCMAGHGCCGKCLQSQVKTLLAIGKKGTLKCRYVACHSFYLVSQLRNSLPAMVVEILEEKLDREYTDNAAKLMMQAVNNPLCSISDGEELDELQVISGSGKEKNVKESDGILDLPKNWEPMSNNEEYKLVDLLRGDDEYNWVSALFHQSMTRPRAAITRIQRVQNQILWQFYMVKKKQMERDNDKPINDKNLFHGTSRNVVDAICRTNFDWRICGSHGTMYGQGSYFARDACYSHMYTDQPLNRAPQQASPNPPLSRIFTQQPPTTQQMMQSAQQAGISLSQQAQQLLFGSFPPGAAHANSIAALQSCRFARLPIMSSNGGQGQGVSNNLSQCPLTGLSSGVSSQSSLSSFPLNFSPHSYWVNPHMPSLFPIPPPTPTSSASSSSSGTLSQESDTHIHCMFLSRVLVGEYTVGKSNYRKPPPVDHSAPYGKCYDACVNDLNNPTIYVIFNHAQCYPEYIIEYTNKPRNAM